MSDDKDISFPIFSIRAEPDAVATKEAGGVPQFRDQEMVTIKIPGIRDEVYRPVEDRDRERWPTMYQRWKQGLSQQMDGIPLSEFATATEGERETLRNMGIQTVEQAAGLNDDAAQKLHCVGLKRRAADFLKLRDSYSPAKTAALEEQIEELKKQLERLTNGHVGAVVSKSNEGNGLQSAEHLPDAANPGRKAVGGVGKRGRQRSGKPAQVAATDV